MSYNMTNELQNLSKEMFPSPLEVNGSSYKHSYDEELQSGSFPSSPEVAGGSYKVYDAGMPAEFEFPSPPEVTEGAYKRRKFNDQWWCYCFRPLAR